MTENTVITVSGDQPYDITIGRDILPLVAEVLPPSARKVLVVHPPTLAAQAAALRETLMAGGERQVLLAEIPDAEFVSARSLLEWRLRHERLTGAAIGFCQSCWRVQRRRRRSVTR